MDWNLAIHRNRTALLTIIIALMKLVGLVCGGQLTTLPRFLYAKALLITRQAESAVRRLIVIAAHDMSVRGVTIRARSASKTDFSLLAQRQPEKAPTFNLIDPLKTFSEADDASVELDFDLPTTNDQGTPFDRTPIPAAALGIRLLALKHALDTIEVQAKRLTRWYGQRDLALKQNHPHRLSPMRPGPPPAARKRRRTEMDTLLRECHLLARDRLNAADTS
jgi:hypothetical protein